MRAQEGSVHLCFYILILGGNDKWNPIAPEFINYEVYFRSLRVTARIRFWSAMLSPKSVL